MKTLLGGWGIVFSERRHAKQASGELLALYRATCLEFPAWSQRDQYKMLVMLRTGCSAPDALTTLRHASESDAH